MEDKGGNFYKPAEQETKWQKFKKVVWNSETREFFGRTGLSWFKITVFYIIFYACLAAFWTCMLVIFYQTLNNDQPKWRLGESRIGTSPGLGFRPSPPEVNADSTLIWYNTTRNDTVEYWVNNLETFLKPYHEYSVGTKIKSCQVGSSSSGEIACHFPIPEGIEETCSSERKFGYPEGKPCVLIKLNRIYGWKPEAYTTPPNEVKELFEQYNNTVFITCIGENSADKDNIGKVNYIPIQGIEFKYFPFTNQDGYVSPFVFVHFANIVHGVLVNVECRAWAQNINFDRGDRLGSVHFELLID